jgi:nitronate monooxygenase
VIGEEEGRPIHLFSTDSPLRSMTGDFEAMALYAGSGVGRVHAISGAAQRVREIIAEAEALLGSGAVAPAGAMDDLHESAANDDVLLPALNELLEAERAGARVALRTAKEVAESDLKPLVSAIHRDEARWCGVLTKAIHQLQGIPSKRMGAFYDKAMAITDISARLAFLNRGQSWVVRKLEALLPGIRDESIHADLTAMLSSHIQNINLVAARLPTAAKPSVEGRT